MPKAAPERTPPKKKTLRDYFAVFARKTSDHVGSAGAFFLALAIIVVWGITGPMFGFSDTWQLVINTGTTIITFLMVFLIQSTQNRDAKAIHLKLDELIRAASGARDDLVLLETMSDEELDALAEQFTQLRDRACHLAERRKGRPKTAKGGQPKHEQQTAEAHHAAH